MTTRTEWAGRAVYRLAVSREFRNALGFTPRRLPVEISFPRTSVRGTPIMGEIVRRTDGNPVALVTPTLGTGAEVTAVLAYLLARHTACPGATEWHPRRVSTREQNYLTRVGFDAPFTQIVPTDALVDIVQDVVDIVDSNFGQYPESLIDITPARPTQTTRMLRGHCAGFDGGAHREYVLRISRTQALRGRPICPLCYRLMTIDGI